MSERVVSIDFSIKVELDLLQAVDFLAMDVET